VRDLATELRLLAVGLRYLVLPLGGMMSRWNNLVGHGNVRDARTRDFSRAPAESRTRVHEPAARRIVYRFRKGQTNVTRSPMVARRRLGTELPTLREAARKKIEDAADALECSTAKISRLESGKGVPRARNVRDLILLYGPKAKRDQDHLLELAEDGRRQDWWNDYGDVVQGEMFADHLLRYVALVLQP
jgi:hypothetical protein